MLAPRISFGHMLILLGVLLVPTAMFAESGNTVSPGSVTISVEQSGPEEGVRGTWSLIKPDYKEVQMQQTGRYEFKGAATGNYTIIATPPAGTSTSTEVAINGQSGRTVHLPQVSFTAADADTIAVHITFAYTRTGKIGVSSEPLGLAYTMQGPTELVYTGTTPAEYLNMPEGLYSLAFDPIEGCATPKPQSGKLIKNGRVNFSVTMSCENLDALPEQIARERALEYVNATINGQKVTFEDVPIREWYAQTVYRMLSTGLMSGYRDDSGVLTGRFGPGDHVTLAQLTKVAHGIAGIDQNEGRTVPSNPRAQSTWFSDYYASAERRGWLVYRSVREDPERLATRGEVVCTLLQALDVHRTWATATVFTDVTFETPYADCIETGAVDHLVDGDMGADGKPTGTFGPERPVNRAELSKILSKAMDLYLKNTLEIRGNYD